MAYATALRTLLTQPPAKCRTRLVIPCCRYRSGSGTRFSPCSGLELSRMPWRGRFELNTRSTGYFLACARKDAMRLEWAGGRGGQRGAPHGSPESRSGAATPAQRRDQRQPSPRLRFSWPCPKVAGDARRWACAMAELSHFEGLAWDLAGCGSQGKHPASGADCPIVGISGTVPPAIPQWLGDAAGVLAVDLHDQRREHRIHVVRLPQHHREAGLDQSGLELPIWRIPG